ncbi:hypothetical protein BP6252_09925 [Coleophoma cylindrospora]|uniref:C3H1-type domain-containing protein n=1 Tax=Coleophoma cylindrospora TaxID=1849047 RepID=A0A3D8QX71_9HELO|nr:hypothetical protein BP6252_09925 [Coleophoma cylindrospora]
MSSNTSLKSPTKGGPTHFLVRTTGEVVPLIAVDELPSSIDIVGVPRSLDLSLTVGMFNLGIMRATSHIYDVVHKKDKEVKGAAKQNISKEELRDEEEKSSSTKETEPETLIARSMASPTVVAPEEPPAPSSNNRFLPCRHWCRHGVCRWGQQCRYQHLMPLTISGLCDVGLTDWPAWYRNQNPDYFHTCSNAIKVRHDAPTYQHVYEQICRDRCCAVNCYHHNHGERSMTNRPITGTLRNSMYASHLTPQRPDVALQSRRMGVVERKRLEDTGRTTLARLRSHNLSVPGEVGEHERLQEEVVKAKQQLDTLNASIANNLRKEILVERSQDSARRAWADLSSNEEGEAEDEPRSEKERATRCTLKAKKSSEGFAEPQLIFL